MAEDLAVIEDETLRAKEIVDGLLDLSRPLPAGAEPVDLRALSDEVVSRLGEARLLDGVAVSVDGRASAPGHPEKLRQVLVNLVRNAAEAAGAGGRVEVRLAERDGARGGRGGGLGAGDPARAARPPVRAVLHDEAAGHRARARGVARHRARARRRARGGRARRRAARGSRCASRCGAPGRPRTWPRQRVLVVDDKENMRRLVARILEDALRGRGGGGRRARARARRDPPVRRRRDRHPDARRGRLRAARRGEGARARRPRSCS